MADRQTSPLSPAVALVATATGLLTTLPPPKPTRLRTPSSSSSSSVTTMIHPPSKTTGLSPSSPPHPPPPVPLPRPAVHPLPSQDSKDTAAPRSASQNGLEEARIRLRSIGTSLEGLSSPSPLNTTTTTNSKAIVAPPPLPPPVATKPIILSNNTCNTQTSPAPPPKPKRMSQQTPLFPTHPPPAPNAKPLSLQCATASNSSSNSSGSPPANSNSSSEAVSTHHQQQPQGDQQHQRTTAQQHHLQGVKLPIVPRARKPPHLQQQQQQQQQQQLTFEAVTPSSAQVLSGNHRRQGASGGGSGGGRGRAMGSSEGPGTETGVSTTTTTAATAAAGRGEGIIGAQTAAAHAHPPNPPLSHAPFSSSLSSLPLEGHAHQRSHSGTLATAPHTTATTTATDLPATRGGESYDKRAEHANNGQRLFDNAAIAAAATDTSTSEASASAALVQARSRLRSTTPSSSPPATLRSNPSSSSASSAPAPAPALTSSDTAAATPKSHHVYPPLEQPSLHPDHYQESYLQQRWDLQENEDDVADQHRQTGRGSAGAGNGSGGAGSERRRVIMNTLEPSTPPTGPSLLTSAVPHHSPVAVGYNTSGSPLSPLPPPLVSPSSSSSSPSSSTSLAVSLQKIQSMVHEQTERIRQVNYAEKKADLAEVVYEKSALWRVRGAEWGGLAKKAWGDRGGVGGLAGGLAERWRRRGDYPIGGGYNPEGKTAGHVDQIFGIPLAEAVKHSQISPSTGVPAVVTRCIEYLDIMGVEEVGLYRISGSSTTVAKMKALFDQGQDYDFLQKGHEPPNPHDVATLLKLYLRELPAPIIPSAMLPAFTQAAASSSSGDAGPDLREQLKQLPLENYLLLATLCQHLSTLAEYEAVTKMSMSNLGLIFCPTLQIGSALFKQLLGGDDLTKKAVSGTTVVTVAAAAANGMGTTDAEGEGRRHDAARRTVEQSKEEEVEEEEEEAEEGEENGECDFQRRAVSVGGEQRALRQLLLARVWADKEARHEEMENLELVKDFEMALEMQQDETRELHQHQPKQGHHQLQRGGSDPSEELYRHHQDHEWDQVDDFDDNVVMASSSSTKVDAAAAASSSSLSTSAPTSSTQSQPLIDLYDEMVMREIDEAASTPLITPPQTIRSAPLPYVSKRQLPPPPPPPPSSSQQHHHRRHAREPAAVLDKSVGANMGRSLVLESAGSRGSGGAAADAANDEFDYAGDKRMSRSFHSGTELQHQQQQQQHQQQQQQQQHQQQLQQQAQHDRAHRVAQRRRSRPPPTFLAGVGMALPSSSSPPRPTSSVGSAGGQASTRWMNGSHLDNNNSNSNSNGHSGGSSDSNGNGIGVSNAAHHHSSRLVHDRGIHGGGSPSTSLSTATSATSATSTAVLPKTTTLNSLSSSPSPPPSSSSATSTTTTTTTPSNSATVFQDLFARPAQPTVSREDARGTKIKRIVNPFETMAVSSSSSMTTTNTNTPPVLASQPHPQPQSPLLPPSRASTTTITPAGNVNEYVQQLQRHEEDNIRLTLDSSARHRRQPAGFERGGGAVRGEVR
ncbi:hypothetical protein DFQ26_006314 [Actinomortierella ambigua]|nr:hypothetical protein DFQ26_006314 [Actinomortierella ambigua]